MQYRCSEYCTLRVYYSTQFEGKKPQNQQGCVCVLANLLYNESKHNNILLAFLVVKANNKRKEVVLT